MPVTIAPASSRWRRRLRLPSRRAGGLLMLAGAVCAGLAVLLVLSVAGAAQAAPKEPLRQVPVVVAVKDIAEASVIRADALAVKPFPAGYVPSGALAQIDDVAGKIAASRIVRDQVLLRPLVTTTRKPSELSAAIPPDKVVFWLGMPDLLAQAGNLRAGDRVDILLSIGLASASGAGVNGAGANGGTKNITTQTTLQNVEIFSLGNAVADSPERGDAAAPATPGASGGGAKAGATAVRVMGLLVDPQEAVLLKFIKDSGGTLDLALRSREAGEPAKTRAVTADTLVDRFGFQVAERWTVGR